MQPSSITSWFEYETGHAWCESAYKYQTVPIVAEFANTITNLPIILLPLLNALLLRRYTSTVNASILIPNLLVTVNGLASTYYHATINLAGQLVDELSILWIINSFAVVYLPIVRIFPQQYHHKIPLLRVLIIAAASLISLLCFVEPNLNAPALMLYSVPSFYVIYYEGKHSGIPEIAGFPRRITLLWTAATACWISDRLFCDVWLYFGVPYLHAAFHLLSSLSVYSVFVMFSLIDIESRASKHNFSVAVRYFPDKSGALLSLPYLSIVEKTRPE